MISQVISWYWLAGCFEAFGSSFIQVESRLGIKGITVYVQSEDLIRFVLSDMVGFKTKKEQFHKKLLTNIYFDCFQNEWWTMNTFLRSTCAGQTRSGSPTRHRWIRWTASPEGFGIDILKTWGGSSQYQNEIKRNHKRLKEICTQNLKKTGETPCCPSQQGSVSVEGYADTNSSTSTFKIFKAAH